MTFPGEEEGDYNHHHEHGLPTLLKLAILVAIAAASILAGWWARGA